MKKMFCMALILSVTCFCTLQSLPFNLESKILESTESAKSEDQVPTPISLAPQWWKYYEVDSKDLPARIQATTKALQSAYQTLSFTEQEIALTRINSIISNLNAYAQAKKQAPKEILPERIFSKSYTLNQQLEVNHKIRKLGLEIKIAEDEYEQQKTSISKADKNVDNLMVVYLAKTKLSSEKLLAGLDVMLRRTALAVSEQNMILLKSKIESHKTQLTHLKKELEVSRDLLDLREYDEIQLESEVQKAQLEYEQSQAALTTAESNTFDLLQDTPQDRSMRHYLDQKVVYAHVSQTLAWSNLSYQMLKYNLIMDSNERFQNDKELLREQVVNWKEKLKQVYLQIKDWKAATLKEQDRVRQEYGMLVAQSENPDSKLLRLNQTRRQESMNILSAIQLLEEKLQDVEWLIDLLDLDIKNKSSYYERVWVAVDAFFTKAWSLIDTWVNFSLFKVSGIPVTFFMLIKMVVILFTTFYASKFVRTALMPIIKKKGHFTDSTLYYLSRLVHYCILLLGGITALVSIGMDFGNLFLLAGALVFGIGFGFQTVANNIFCGFRILFERKIKLGDYIELQSGRYGKVTEIQLQHTVITTSDGIDIIVPNSELIDKTLINWTMNNDIRRIRVPFSTGTTVDKDLVRKEVSQAAKRVPCTVHGNSKFSDPQVWLVKFGENSLDFELVVWVNLRTKSFTESRDADYIWEIETALRENNIEMPVSEQRLFLHHIRPRSLELADKSVMKLSVANTLNPDQFQVRL